MDLTRTKLVDPQCYALRLITLMRNFSNSRVHHIPYCFIQGLIKSLISYLSIKIITRSRVLLSNMVFLYYVQNSECGKRHVSCFANLIGLSLGGTRQFIQGKSSMSDCEWIFTYHASRQCFSCCSTTIWYYCILCYDIKADTLVGWGLFCREIRLDCCYCTQAGGRKSATKSQNATKIHYFVNIAERKVLDLQIE